MADDIAGKLAALLDYWLEHNREHEAEFRDWAEKAGSLPAWVARELRRAADAMAEASECLEKARRSLPQKK